MIPLNSIFPHTEGYAKLGVGWDNGNFERSEKESFMKRSNASGGLMVGNQIRVS